MCITIPGPRRARPVPPLPHLSLRKDGGGQSFACGGGGGGGGGGCARRAQEERGAKTGEEFVSVGSRTVCTETTFSRPVLTQPFLGAASRGFFGVTAGNAASGCGNRAPGNADAVAKAASNDEQQPADGKGGGNHETQQQRFALPSASKKKVRRHRTPQKPGLTAKMNQRHFVKHNYHDHANDVDSVGSTERPSSENSRDNTFPMKLHSLLDRIEADGFAHVVSWAPHGRAFLIHKPRTFVDEVMPKYFRQTKLTSFQRQLNLYGFQRITRGPDSAAYYHELFLRGKRFLTKKMVRVRVKGTKYKAASSPEQEPDFYSMVPVGTQEPREDETTGDDEGSASKTSSLSASTESVDTKGCRREKASKPVFCPPTDLPEVVSVPFHQPPPRQASVGLVNQGLQPPPVTLGSPNSNPVATGKHSSVVFPNPNHCLSMLVRPLSKGHNEKAQGGSFMPKLWNSQDPQIPTPEAPDLSSSTKGALGCSWLGAHPSRILLADTQSSMHGPTSSCPSVSATSSSSVPVESLTGFEFSTSHASVSQPHDDNELLAKPAMNTQSRDASNEDDEALFERIVEEVFLPLEKSTLPPAPKEQQTTPQAHMDIALAPTDFAMDEEHGDVLLSFAREWAPEAIQPDPMLAPSLSARPSGNAELMGFEHAVRNMRDDADLGVLLEKLVDSS